MRVARMSAIRTVVMLASCCQLLGACSVDEFEPAGSAPQLVNACEEDADCDGSGTCGPGMCVASSGDVAVAFIEVIPPAVAYYGAGESFLIPLEGLAQGDWNRNLELPSYAQVEGSLTVSAGLLGDPPSESCEKAYDPATQSLRVYVKFSRSEAPRGLPSLMEATNAELTNGGWQFSEKLPAGRYDVYATAVAGCDDDFPPILARNQELKPGLVSFGLHVGDLSTLSGIVTPPSAGADHVSLAGWQVSLLEPRQGKTISTTRNLSDSNPTNFELRYQPMTQDAPLLLLSPPEGQVAPEVIWDLSVLDLDGDGQVAPNLEALDLSTVHVRARIIDANVTPIVDASVRLRSTHLLGATHGLSARYQTDVVSDEEGAIDLDILPGSYQIIVTPPDPSDLAITESTWEVARTPAEQAGRTVEVSAKESLRGTVLAPSSDQPLRGVSVNLLPSVQEPGDFLEQVLEREPMVPRFASRFTDDLGMFVIPVDPGRADLSVKPAESSRFPWIVHARVQTPGPALDRMSVSFPVPLAGTIRDPSDNPVQRALLKVFALLDDTEPSGLARSTEPTAGDAVLQIAEGRSDQDGNFLLLLPSKITTP